MKLCPHCKERPPRKSSSWCGPCENDVRKLRRLFKKQDEAQAAADARYKAVRADELGFDIDVDLAGVSDTAGPHKPSPGGSTPLPAKPDAATFGGTASANPLEHVDPIFGLKRVLFVPDTHVPYHDPQAWAVMLAGARLFKPDVIVILGDFADFYAVSSHSKNPERRADLDYEVGLVKEKLAELDSLGASRRVYIAGNHEDRLSRYLMDHAPALFGSVSIPEVLGLHERGWEYVPYREFLRLGKLRITHDTGKAGVNAHRQAMGSFRHSTVIGHTHRMEMSVAGSADGSPAVAAMFGWLGSFEHVDYMHRIESQAAWVHGFGLGFMEPTGVVHLTPVPIVNGAACVLGQVIRV